MVAVVTGSRLGLEQTSAWVLGSRGQIGQASLGRGGDNVFVNAATGNLVVTNRDEFLVGLGTDSIISRSYNSQGALDGDNNDGWRVGATRRVFGLIGTLNAAGSTITRTDWDGSQVVYNWNAAKSAYETREGAGAHDLLKKVGADWVWTDGDSQAAETYAASGVAGEWRIVGQADTDGNSLSFAYNSAGYVSRVTTQDGGYTDLSYSGANLTQLTTTWWDAASSSNKTLTRTRYAYDASNRLTSVTVDLSPNDNAVADGKTYVTTYTYDGTSKRVASISQTDGSRIDITYETSGQFRVTSISQGVAAGVTRTTGLTYVSATRTDVTGPDGLITQMEYNAAGQLTKITEPAATAGGTPQVREFTYDADGNVTRIKTSPTTWTDYVYPVGAGGTGLWTAQYQRVGTGGYLAATRTYNSRNAVLTETRYQTLDADGTGAAQATQPLTTRYVYDSENHLRYVVSPTGSVARYDYAPNGNLIRTSAFTGAAYPVAGLADDASIAETAMNTWAAALADKTQAQITETIYDFRGAVTQTIAYSTVLGTGGADGGSAATRTNYVYDQSGKLLSRAVTGVPGSETFLYDGLGRMISAVDFNSETTTTAFHDALGTTVVRLADGLSQVSVHNRAGERISYSETERGANLVDLGGWPQGAAPGGTATVPGWLNPASYTNETQWAVVNGPDGRQVVAIQSGQPDPSTSGGGNFTNLTPLDPAKAYEFVFYFRKSDLTRHGIYFGLSAPGGTVENGTNGADNNTPYFFTASAAQQQAMLQNDRWYKVVGYVLPQGSALVAAGSLGGVYDTTTGVKVASTTTFRWNDTVSATEFRARFFNLQDEASLGFSTYFYQPEIRQFSGDLVAELLPATGTQYRYDNQGRLRLEIDPTGVQTHHLYDRVGRKVGQVDADGSLVEYRYDLADRLVATVRYATRLTTTQLNSLTDASGNPTGVELAAVRPAAVADDAWSWSVYDDAGRLLQNIDGEGAATVYAYDGASRLLGQTSYANRLTAAQLTAFKATPPTAVTLPTASATTDRVTRYFHDADGRRIGALDGEGFFSRVVYDKAGRVTRTDAFAEKVTTAALLATGSFDALLAEVQAPVNAADIVSWSVYDGRGFLRGTVGGEGEVTLYDYSPLGHVIQVVTGRKLASVPTTQPTLAQLTAAPASPVIETTNWTRNAYGQALTETRALAGGTETTTYVYDALRQLVSTSVDRLANQGPDYGSRQRYDRRGRLIGQLGGEGTAALMALGAVPTKAQVDALYRQYGVTFTYDAADRLIARTDANGVNDLGHRTLYFYDADGNLAYQANAEGEVVGYAYDALNRQTRTIVYADRVSAAHLAALTGGPIPPLNETYSRTTPPATATVTTIAYNVTGTIKESEQRLTATESAKTLYAYNVFGEVITRTDPKGTTAAPLTSATTCAYDRRGLTTNTVEDSGGINRITISSHDAFGRTLTVTDPRGAVRTSGYDRAGRVIVSKDAFNNQTTYAYDARGHVLTATDRLGKATSFTHDAFSRRVTMTTAEGLVTVTTHDDQGHTLSITDGAARTTTYAYDLNGALKSTTNGLGQQAVNTYDFAGHLYETVDASGVKVRFTYDAAGRVLTEAVDPTGLNLVTSYAYDAKGQRILVTDPGGVRTGYQFDLAGRTTEVIADPVDATHPNGLNLRTVYTLDRAGNVAKVTEAFGKPEAREMLYTYDKLDRLITQQTGPAALNILSTYAYDANGNVTSRTDKLNATQSVVTRYVYDAENRLTWTVDGTGAVTRNQYDAEGRVIRTTGYAGLISIAGAVLTEAQILPALAASATRTTDYVYDNDGRLTYTVQADGRLTRFHYDGSGNVTGQTVYGKLWLSYDPNYALAWPYTVAGFNGVTAMTAFKNDPGNRASSVIYDAANRARYSVDAMGFVTAFVVDGAGKVTRHAQFAAAYSGDRTEAALAVWSASAQPSDRITRFAYDAAGRMTFSVDAEGYVSRTTYDDAGHVTDESRFAPVFSVSDGVTQATLTSLVATHVSTAATTAYGYDAAGRNTSVMDAGGIVTLMQLDGLGRAVRVTAAHGTTDASVTYREYDGGGRVVLETRGEGTSEASTSKWTYDGLGRALTAMDGEGYKKFLVDGIGYATTRTYDAMGRVLTVTAPLAPGATAFTPHAAATTTNEYDAFGNLTKVIDPKGAVGLLVHDALNRLISQTDPANIVTTTTYGVGGEVLTVTRAGATTTIARDKLDRVVAITDAQNKTETYQLNAFGDRVSVTNKLGGVTTYTYDKRGLMLAEVLPVSSIRADGTVQAASVTNKFEYDARGNQTRTIEAFGLTEVRTTNYLYDKLDRLVSKTSDAVTVTSSANFATSTVTPTETIAYDKRGNVIETVNASGARTLFYYDDLNRKVAEIDAAGTLRKWTYDANNNAIAARAYDTPMALPAAGGATPAGTGTYRETLYAYDRGNRLVTTTVAALRVGEFGSAYTTSVSDVVVRNVYDAAGHVVQVIDGRSESSFAFYDALGRQVATVDAEGYLTTFVRDAEGNVTQEVRYAIRVVGAVAWNRVASTLPPRTANAALGDRITDFTYDKNGRRLTEIRRGVQVYSAEATDRLATADAQIAYVYDGLGNVVKKTEANGDYVDYGYDLIGRQTSELASVFTDYLGASVRHQTTTAYNGWSGVTRVQEGKQSGAVADARVTTFTYAGGRLSSMTDPTAFTRNFGYDAAGRVTAETYVRVKGDGTSATEGRRYQYDVLGRLSLESAASLSGSWSFGDTRSNVYNAHGEVTERRLNGVLQESFAYDMGGRMWRSTGGDGVYRYYLYDKAGRATLVVTPGSASGIHAASDVEGLLETLTDSGDHALGAWDMSFAALTFNLYDKRGLAIGTRDPFRQLSRDLQTLAYTTTTVVRGRAHNAFGEVVSETDARGFTTDFTYNTMGRIIETRRPTVAFTNEQGVVSSARPTEQSRFDVSGRLIATRTANGYWTSRTLLAGSGHNGEDAIAVGQLNPDGGSITYGADVFGDIRKVTDQLGAITLNTYDKAGQLISVQHPGRAAYSAGNNTGSLVQLTDYYAYDGLGQRIQHWNSQFGTSFKEKTVHDREGRVVSQIDFENHATTYSYVWNATLSTAGMGASGGSAIFGGWIKTTTHASGKVGIERLDSFGRLTGKTDLGGRTYAMGFDQAGRLISQTSGAPGSGLATGAQSLTWSWYNTGLMAEQKDISGAQLGYSTAATQANYTYDAAGNRVSERYLTTETTYVYDPYDPYDLYGSYYSPLTPVQTITLRQDGRAVYDALGRMTGFTDLADSTTDPTRVDYAYDLNGNVRSITSDYRYIGQTATVAVPEANWYKYDAMDRMVHVEGKLTGGVISGGRQLEYDAAGNRVRMMTALSILTDIQNGTTEVWVPLEGPPRPPPVGGEPVEEGDQGYWQTVPTYETRSGFTVENYDYTADGYLARVGQSHDAWDAAADTVVRTAVDWRSSDIRDAMGRLTLHQEYANGGGVLTHSRSAVYDRSGLITSEATSTWTMAGSGQSAYTTTTTTNYSYYEGSIWRGVVTGVTVSSSVTSGTQPKPTSTTYAYTWWDDARQATITFDSDTTSSSNTLHASTFGYDVNGRISYVNIRDGRPRNVTFVTDANGQVLSRKEADSLSTGDPQSRYWYFNGQRVGETTNNYDWGGESSYFTAMTARTARPGSANAPFVNGTNNPTLNADFDQAYEALTPNSVRGAGTAWTVRDGDTLAGIAAAVWGDASLWYLIAEANGLTSASLLSAGQTLTVPAKAGNVHNTAETFRPYDPNKALGDLNPTQPKPPAKANKGCGVVGQIIMVVIAVAVTIWTAGALSAATGGILGTIGSSAVATGAVAGAAGSIASQVFGLATGIQDKFDWKGVALSAISGGVAKGLGNWSKFSNAVDKLARGNAAVNAALHGAAGSVVTQGVAVATGLQDKFSWTSVAVSAVGAGVGRAVLSNHDLTGFKADFLSGLAGGTAGAATKSLIDGSSFGDNLVATLPSIIGNTIGNMVAGGIQAKSERTLSKLDSKGGAWGGMKDGRSVDLLAQPRAYGSCFLPDTLVKTRDGSRRIADIRVGDHVASRDEHMPDGPVRFRPVTHALVHEHKSVLDIDIRYPGGATERISATAEHPFHVRGAGWVEAGDLKVGDILDTGDATSCAVEAIEAGEADVTVHNLTVDEDHTYFVGLGNIWVHNKMAVQDPDAHVDGDPSSPGYVVLSRQDITDAERKNPQLLRDQGYEFDEERNVWFLYREATEFNSPSELDEVVVYGHRLENLLTAPSPQLTEFAAPNLVLNAYASDAPGSKSSPFEFNRFSFNGMAFDLSYRPSDFQAAPLNLNATSYNGMCYTQEAYDRLVPQARAWTARDAQAARDRASQEEWLRAPVGLSFMPDFASTAYSRDWGPASIRAGGELNGHIAVIGGASTGALGGRPAAFSGRPPVGRSGPAYVQAIEGATARAARLGREGEAAAGITGPKAGVEINGRMRFPDELSPTLLKEVKNVNRQGWTRQLRDYSDLARQRGIPFELWVRQNTQLTRPLRDAEIRGDVIIRRELPGQ